MLGLGGGDSIVTNWNGTLGTLVVINNPAGQTFNPTVNMAQPISFTGTFNVGNILGVGNFIGTYFVPVGTDFGYKQDAYL
jgi:hypothetical protein